MYVVSCGLLNSLLCALLYLPHQSLYSRRERRWIHISTSFGHWLFTLYTVYVAILSTFILGALYTVYVAIFSTFILAALYTVCVAILSTFILGALYTVYVAILSTFILGAFVLNLP